eukprot:5106317-Alexandrium_andersonii.AAC.1
MWRASIGRLVRDSDQGIKPLCALAASCKHFKRCKRASSSFLRSLSGAGQPQKVHSESCAGC